MAYLWVPESARAEPVDYRYRCLVRGCGKAFSNRNAYASHVARCAKKNSDEVEAVYAEQTSSAFTSTLDKEQTAWVRKRRHEGKTMRGTLGGRQGLPKKQQPREAAKED